MQTQGSSDGINWLVTLLVSVLLGVVGNLITNPLHAWLSRSIRAVARRRIRRLKAGLELVTELATSTRALLSWSVRRALVLLLSLFASILSKVYSVRQQQPANLTASALVTLFEDSYFARALGVNRLSALLFSLSELALNWAILIMFVMSLFLFINGNWVLQRVQYFDEYKPKAERQIHELSEKWRIE